MIRRNPAIDRFIQELLILAKGRKKLPANALISAFHRHPLTLRDWMPYALVDDAQPYTRNLIARLPDESKLMLLMWSPGRASPVHSHAHTHCIMKILHGRLSETLYEWPSPAQVAMGKPLSERGRRDLKAGQVAYMSDEMGIHKMENPDHGDFAVSLHLYMARPELQATSVKLFDEHAGVPSESPPAKVHSEGGVLLEH